MAIYNVEIQYPGQPWQQEAGPFTTLEAAQEYKLWREARTRETSDYIANASREYRDLVQDVIDTTNSDRLRYLRSENAKFRIVS